jgi:opacity protein-like surface antigen
MKSLNTLLALAVMATTAFAGPSYTGKNPKAPILPPPPPPPGCACFGAGGAFDIFGAAFIPEGGDTEVGGGVGVNYFFNRNFGIDVNYGLYATDKEHHQFDANLVLRAPIDSLCIAPYILAGGGYATNSNNTATYQVGAGIDIRIPSANCLGIFAEGLYHFAESDVSDFTTVRLGVRIPF